MARAHPPCQRAPPTGPRARPAPPPARRGWHRRRGRLRPSCRASIRPPATGRSTSSVIVSPDFSTRLDAPRTAPRAGSKRPRPARYWERSFEGDGRQCVAIANQAIDTGGVGGRKRLGRHPVPERLELAVGLASRASRGPTRRVSTAPRTRARRRAPAGVRGAAAAGRRAAPWPAAARRRAPRPADRRRRRARSRRCRAAASAGRRHRSRCDASDACRRAWPSSAAVPSSNATAGTPTARRHSSNTSEHVGVAEFHPHRPPPRPLASCRSTQRSMPRHATRSGTPLAAHPATQSKAGPTTRTRWPSLRLHK